MNAKTSRNSPLNLYGTALRIYDNGGKTADRYTIVPPRNATSYRFDGADNWGARWGWACIVSSTTGHVSGHETATPGAHLGRRIHWRDLPESVRLMCYRDFARFVPELETVARHFIIAAIWADAEEGTHPRASAATLHTAREFCAAFIGAHAGLFAAAMNAPGYGSHPDAGSNAAAFGHDLYLTAAGHGIGFDDRDALAFSLDEDDDTDENTLGQMLARVVRKEWRRWHVETSQYRGWFELSAANYDVEG